MLVNPIRHGLRDAMELEVPLISLGSVDVSHHEGGCIVFPVSGGHCLDSADSPDTCGVAFQLDNDVDGAVDLISDGLDRQRDIRHGGQCLQTAERVCRGVGVHGGQRALVTCVHGLKHVERLATADLADDDAIRTHAQRVSHQITNRHLPRTFSIGRTCLQADHMGLLQGQLGGVLNGDDPLSIRNHSGQRIEEGRLSGAGPTGDENVEPGYH